MVDLVTLDEARDRLSIAFLSQDDKIADMAAEATDIVIGYIDKPDHGWTAATAPRRIRTAIFLVLARIYANDGQPVLTDAVKSILRRDRKPVVA